MAKHYIIYETKNLKDGKIYIGMHETDNLEDGYLGSGKRLKRAIRYYGKEFFERKILFTFDNREDMIAKEIELVNEEFFKRKDTYNLKLGGEGGLINEEHKKKWILNGQAAARVKLKELHDNSKWLKAKVEKISKTMKEKYKHGLLNVNTFQNRKHSEESKNKIRNTITGKQSGSNNSQFGKTWITNGKDNMKIWRGSEIPEGWKLGRKIK